MDFEFFKILVAELGLIAGAYAFLQRYFLTPYKKRQEDQDSKIVNLEKKVSILEVKDDTLANKIDSLAEALKSDHEKLASKVDKISETLNQIKGKLEG